MFNRTHTPFGAGMQLWRKQSRYFEKYKNRASISWLSMFKLYVSSQEIC